MRNGDLSVTSLENAYKELRVKSPVEEREEENSDEKWCLKFYEFRECI